MGKTLTEIINEMRTYLVTRQLHDGDLLDATEIHCVLNSFADELEAWSNRSDLLRVPVPVWNNMASKVEKVDKLMEALRIIKQMGIDLRNMTPHLNQKTEACLKQAIRIYQLADSAMIDYKVSTEGGTK